MNWHTRFSSPASTLLAPTHRYYQAPSHHISSLIFNYKFLIFSILFFSLLYSSPVHAFIKEYGKEKIVQYEKYGHFEGIGTEQYHYVMTDRKGLGEAQGEGIYPNTWSLYKDKGFLRARERGLLEGNQWDYVQSDDNALCFYKWAISFAAQPGMRQFFIARALEREGLIEQALKAYYAIVVFFPSTTAQTYWHTPWYVGQSALDKIYFLCKTHPEIPYELVGARIYVNHKFDNDTVNDVFIVSPGKFIPRSDTKNSTPPPLTKITVQHYGQRFTLVQYTNKHWQLFVDNKPFIVKGCAYEPTMVGQSPDKGTLQDWMTMDTNRNGIPDTPFETFVDENENNQQDADETTVGDFQLMQNMGVNTIRIYHHTQHNPDDAKKILRTLYKKHGIMTMMGDCLGMYALGSNALWYEGTDYTNPLHCKNMMASVEKMVLAYKDEPFLLMWILGNENVYGTVGIENKVGGTGCKGGAQAAAYFTFVEKAAKRIKELDPNHPIAIANGDTLHFDLCAQYCPSIDIFGCNAYRGSDGFGISFWDEIANTYSIPVLITEYGCPAFHSSKDEKTAANFQRIYHQNAWEDIVNNTAGKGRGIAIGGIIFEWLDEWWKAYFPAYHDYTGQWAGPFPDGWMYEEWLGICSQGNGRKSPFLRQPRETYLYYKKTWNEHTN